MRERKYTGEQQELPKEESHPMTDSQEENSINPANKQEKSVLKPHQIQ